MVEPSIDKMWGMIEGFGINRETIDPHNSMMPEEVEARIFL